MSISVVNSSNAFAAGAATTIASPATSLTAGNTIVVGLRLGTTALSLISLTDTAGNTYRPTGAGQHTGASGLQVWYASNVTGNGSNVVTATFNSTTNISLLTLQISGLSAYPQDTWNISTSTTSATPTTAALTTVTANEIIVVFGENDASGSAWTASAGYTLGTQDSSNFQGVAYEIVSSIQTGITPSITSADSTNHKVAVAVTFWATAPSASAFGPGTIVIADSDSNNGLNGVTINSVSGATIDTRLPLGAFDGNGAGEGGAVLSNGTFLVPSKVTSTGTVRSIQIYNASFVQQSITQPLSSTHWDTFSPMASDFNSTFWVSAVSLISAATQVRSVLVNGTLGGTTFTLDDNGGPLVSGMGVSQDNTTLYYSLRTNGGGIKKWNLVSNTSAGALIASGGTAYFNADLIVVPGSSSFVSIIQPAGVAGTSYQLNRYSTVNGSLISSVALTGNLGNFSPVRLALDLGTPGTAVWVRGYADGTGATTTFQQISLVNGTTLQSFTVNMNDGGTGGGPQNQVPLSCPFFVWTAAPGLPVPPWPTSPPFTVGTGGLQAVPLRRLRRVPFPVAPGNAKQRVARIELQFQPGTGIASAPTTPPEFMVRMSFDQGHTWSMERVVSGGQMGSYSTRAFANGWGHGRWPVIEVTASDQTDWVLTDCFAVVSAGDR